MIKSQVVVHCIFPFKGRLENDPLYNPDFHDGIVYILLKLSRLLYLIIIIFVSYLII